ncbi:unnamed protein product [Cochlearia groenlandica]
MSNRRRSNGDDDKGLLWKLPQIRIRDVGKVGPALGLGLGCGFGFGAGLIGGLGFGPGVPGLQFGLGFGAGCGIGVGFGYGVGRGAAYDHSRSYHNVGKPSLDEVDSLIDELVVSTKRFVKATSKEIDKWRRL